MNNNFYDELDFKYTEIGEITGETDNKFKVYIGSLMPKLDSGSPKKEEKPRGNVSKILNKSARDGIEGVTVANYIPIPKPDGLDLDKGDKVIVTFPGGEVNHPRIIGKY